MSPDREQLLTDQQAAKTSRRHTLKSFAWFGACGAAGYASWRQLMNCSYEDGVLWPIRRVLRFNEKLSEMVFHRSSRMTELPAGTAQSNPRLNSSIGVDGLITAENYRLHLSGIVNDAVQLTLNDIKAFPKIRQTTQLCCIEGWNTWGNWTGVRLTDLAAKYRPRGNPPYVAMSTADASYYVGLDTASALHPQTLLVYALDDAPLSVEHGYPLRLVIPTKYGIKNIKQVCNIQFTHTRPADYWAELGYDWYSGL